MRMNVLDDYENNSSPGIVLSIYSNTLPSILRDSKLVTPRHVLGKLNGMMKRTNQRLKGLQHQAQQPRLATEADVKTGTKTRKRTEDAVADGEKDGYISSARAENGPMSLTSFGKIYSRTSSSRKMHQ